MSWSSDINKFRQQEAQSRGDITISNEAFGQLYGSGQGSGYEAIDALYGGNQIPTNAPEPYETIAERQLVQGSGNADYYAKEQEALKVAMVQLATRTSRVDAASMLGAYDVPLKETAVRGAVVGGALLAGGLGIGSLTGSKSASSSSMLAGMYGGVAPSSMGNYAQTVLQLGMMGSPFAYLAGWGLLGNQTHEQAMEYQREFQKNRELSGADYDWTVANNARTLQALNEAALSSKILANYAPDVRYSKAYQDLVMSQQSYESKLSALRVINQVQYNEFAPVLWSQQLSTEKAYTMKALQSVQTEAMRTLEAKQSIQTEYMRTLEAAESVRTQYQRTLQAAESVRTQYQYTLKAAEAVNTQRAETLYNLAGVQLRQASTYATLNPYGEYTDQIRRSYATQSYYNALNARASYNLTSQQLNDYNTWKILESTEQGEIRGVEMGTRRDITGYKSKWVKEGRRWVKRRVPQYGAEYQIVERYSRTNPYAESYTYTF